MISPITPDEVIAPPIPDEVIEIFNSFIKKNYRVASCSSRFLQKDVLAAIQAKLGNTPQHVFDNGWLDVEPLYMQAGWQVKYDKPGYNESYDASFTFSKVPKRIMR